MARKCKGCGALLSSYNPGLLCWPCQDKKKERLQEQIGDIPHYTVDDLCFLLGFAHPESVKRLGRKSTIPGRLPGIRQHLYLRKEVDQWIHGDQQDVPIAAVIKQEQIYREGTVATVAGQGKLFSIELPMRQAILHQFRVIGSRSSVFMVMVSESASTYVDAMQSNIGIFQSHGRVAQETFRLPDWYYEDKDGGTHLHLEITPLIDQYLKPQTPVEFRVGVWFTSISQ